MPALNIAHAAAAKAEMNMLAPAKQLVQPRKTVKIGRPG